MVLAIVELRALSTSAATLPHAEDGLVVVIGNTYQSLLRFHLDLFYTINRYGVRKILIHLIGIDSINLNYCIDKCMLIKLVCTSNDVTIYRVV